MQTPLVSIIIPTYNRAHLIGETLDSVLAQTYANWECIVVDDGSTDETDSLLANYCANDSRFQYHHRPSDRPKGANACRNFGFEVSKGEYVNWFDSDDLMISNKIELQLKSLYNSSCKMAVCQTMVFEGDKSNTIGLRKSKIYSADFFNDFICDNIKWLTQAPLIEKIFLKKNKIIFDEILMQSQERDYFIKVLSVLDNYIFDNTPLVLFRNHKNSISGGEWTIKKIESSFVVDYNTIKNFKYKLNDNTFYKLKKKLKAKIRLAASSGMSKLSFKLFKLVKDDIIELSFYEKNKILIGIYSLKFFKRGEIFFN